MKIYRVGGSVRDELLGLPVVDRDWVVVGATPQDMTDRGFKPVGRDFPVFLHPDTHEEYALARTERKSGRGHQGFDFHADPSVTLEADLARRDLTINAMAIDEGGSVIDPFGGRSDLDARILRHVSPAFAEDPLRVLRVARFAARFGFEVAAHTEAMMRDLVDGGELSELSAERVWREVSLGLLAPLPSRMLSTLRRAGALAVLLPEVEALFPTAVAGDQPDAGVATCVALDRGAGPAAGVGPPGGGPSRLVIQYSVLARWMTTAAVQAMSARIRAANDCRDAAMAVVRHAGTIAGAATLDAAAWLDLLTGIDALRRPERVDTLVAVDQAYRRKADVAGREVAALARGAAAALASVDYSALARGDPDPSARARSLRIEALERWLAARH